MTNSFIFWLLVFAILSIGLLITTGVLTGTRLMSFVCKLLLLLAGMFAACWIWKLLLIPGAVRILDALKAMAVGLAYMAFAIILLFAITQLTIFTFSKHPHRTETRGKKEL